MSTPTYILDFDDCLFDTARFKAVLERYGIDVSTRSDASIEQVQAHASELEGNLRSFIFPDAVEWLQSNGSACHIVTSYISRDEAAGDHATLRAFQEAKLAAAAIYEYIAPERVHMVAHDKGEVLATLKQAYPASPLMLIDNHPGHLETGHQEGVTPVQIVREAHVPEGERALTELVTWPIIYSFAELPAITQWLFPATGETH